MMKNVFFAVVLAMGVSNINAELFYATVTQVDIYSSGNFGMDEVFIYDSVGGGDADGGLEGDQFVTPPPVPGLSAYAANNLVYDDTTGIFTWAGDIKMLGGAAAHDVVLSDGTIDTNNFVGLPNGITTGTATCIDNSDYGACGPTGWNSASWIWNNLTVVGTGVGSVFQFSDSADWNDLDEQLAVRQGEVDTYGVAFTDATALQDSLYHYRLKIKLVAAGAEFPVAIPVPVPAAVWLFASALLGLVGVRRAQLNS
jgi:hypothetical protein